MLPGLFPDLDAFQEWFALPSMASYAASPRATRLINTLHAILRPFLLRRLKADVETGLPPKKEYVLYAPLSVRQREVYDAVLSGHLRALLLNESKGKGGEGEGEGKEDEVEESAARRTRRRSGKRRTYNDDGDDEEYFRKLEAGELDADRERRANAKTAEELGREWQLKGQSRCFTSHIWDNTNIRLQERKSTT